MTPRRSGLDDWLPRLVQVTALYLILYAIFGGVARYALLQINALALNNFPSLLITILLVGYYLDALRRRRISRLMLILPLVFMLFGLYALTMPLSLWQIVMGFYIWLPFILGVLLALCGGEEKLLRWMPLFWSLSVTGLFLNLFWSYPWVGQSYDVKGAVMDVARDWDASGYQRLPGFSRMSFSVACHVLLSCGLLLLHPHWGLGRKLIIYTLSVVAVFLTTSKAPLGLVIGLPLILWLYYWARRRDPSGRLAYRYARGVLFLIAGLVILLPVLLSGHDSHASSQGSWMFLNGDSFMERVTQMWPDAFDIVSKHGNVMVGAGVGAIGMGMALHQPELPTMNAADNLFVYVYVEAGIAGIILLMVGILAPMRRLYYQNEPCFRRLWLLSLSLLGVGITASVLEEPLLAMLLGYLMTRGYTATALFPVDDVKNLSKQPS